MAFVTLAQWQIIDAPRAPWPVPMRKPRSAPAPRPVRLHALLGTLMVHLLLVVVLLSRFTIGSGENRDHGTAPEMTMMSVNEITEAQPTPAGVPSHPQPVTGTPQPATSSLPQVPVDDRSRTEWTQNQIKVAVPLAPTGGIPASAQIGRQASAGCGELYDPYAGVAPIRRPDSADKLGLPPVKC